MAQKRKAYVGLSKITRAAKRRRGGRAPSGLRIPPGPYNPMLAGSVSYPRTTGERKYYETQLNKQAINTTSMIVSNSVLAMGTGSTASNRVGLKIRGDYLHVRGILHKDCLVGESTTMNCEDLFRFIVYLDKQPNGTVPNPNDIRGYGNSTTGDLQFTSFNNISNGDRFVILKDKVITMTRETLSTFPDGMGDATIFSFGSDKYFQFSIPLKGLVTTFVGTVGDYGSVKTNNIGIMVQSPLADIFALSMTTRYRYSDN